MAILGVHRPETGLQNRASCPFPLLREQRGEPIASPYALHLGTGWMGKAVPCAVVVACGEEKPNRIAHEWKHVTCKRCLGVKSGAHVTRKKSASPRKKRAVKAASVKEAPQKELFPCRSA
jgi:hypothetical protein